MNLADVRALIRSHHTNTGRPPKRVTLGQDAWMAFRAELETRFVVRGPADTKTDCITFCGVSVQLDAELGDAMLAHSQ